MANVQVHVQRVETLSRERIKVKIAETGVGLNTMIHNGKNYEVTKNLGRGRYIMRPSTATVVAEGRRYAG